MISLLVSVGSFFVTIAVHVLLHRVLARWGIRTVKTIMVYAVGVGILTAIVWSRPFALTAIALYSVLVAAFLLYFLSFFVDAESPSAKLMGVLKKHGPLEEKQIVKFFSDKEIFEGRLAMLAQTGYIVQRNSRYIATKKGMVIARLFERYRKILRWDKGGL